jgi:hypothetical protein
VVGNPGGLLFKTEKNCRDEALTGATCEQLKTFTNIIERITAIEEKSRRAEIK